MAYSVDNIVPVILRLTPAGLTTANFASAVIFANTSDLAGSAPTFAENTYKDFSDLSELGEYFNPTNDVYLMATRWFANIPKPPQITVWMRADADDVTESSNACVDEIFRFFHFWKESISSTSADYNALADFADANERYTIFFTQDSDVVDNQVSNDIASDLQAKGNRFVSVAYVPASIVSQDASQIYAGIQLAASYYKFVPEASRTAIDFEFQVLPGVIGSDLPTTQYNTLKAKDAIFFTQIELKGSVDNSRAINTKSMSSFGEFMNDVCDIAVLKNFLQVAGYNYITSGKKGLRSTKDYAGLINRVEETFKQFFDNGVLGQAEYTDLSTGETKLAKYGFVVSSKPEDVLSLTQSQINERKYPPIRGRVFRNFGAHEAELVIDVE